jgi:hypothetical protein
MSQLPAYGLCCEFWAVAIISWGYERRTMFPCLPPEVHVDVGIDMSSSAPVPRFPSGPHVGCLGNAEAEIGDELHPGGNASSRATAPYLHAGSTRPQAPRRLLLTAGSE